MHAQDQLYQVQAVENVLVMPGGEPTALCRGASRQRYAPTALCSNSVMPSVMPSQRYALLALCLASVMPCQRYALPALCHSVRVKYT